tara:strand:- start:657 stop:863 length:207 start_codon:yes stop_codon:yes gene_type:complete
MQDRREVLFEIVNDYPEIRKCVKLETQETINSQFTDIVKSIDAMDPTAETARVISKTITNFQARRLCK